jgi:alpha-ketoglutarate-dependent taurine dioxygenase
MKISKIPGLGSFGHYIDDINFDHITDEEWIEIGKLHLKGLVTILRNVKITKDQYHQRIQQFGPMKGTRNSRAHFIAKYGPKFDALKPELFDELGITDEDKIFLNTKKHFLETTEGGAHLTRITGLRDDQGNMLGVFSDGELYWHSNESSELTFAPGVALLGGQYMVGSSTGFVQTVDYYESLSESFKSELDEMVLIHKYIPGKINDREKTDQQLMVNIKLGFCAEDGAEVPLVIQSPGGIKGLHYTINTAAGIKGMSETESKKVFDAIDKELFSDKYVFDHWYQQDNDLLLFDNSITLHRRLPGNPNRVAYRIQYDYNNLLDNPWYPYYQEEYANKYKQQTYELIKILGIKDFKLP